MQLAPAPCALPIAHYWHACTLANRLDWLIAPTPVCMNVRARVESRQPDLTAAARPRTTRTIYYMAELQFVFALALAGPCARACSWTLFVFFSFVFSCLVLCARFCWLLFSPSVLHIHDVHCTVSLALHCQSLAYCELFPCENPASWLFNFTQFSLSFLLVCSYLKCYLGRRSVRVSNLSVNCKAH